MFNKIVNFLSKNLPSINSLSKISGHLTLANLTAIFGSLGLEELAKALTPDKKNLSLPTTSSPTPTTTSTTELKWFDKIAKSDALWYPLVGFQAANAAMNTYKACKNESKLGKLSNLTATFGNLSGGSGAIAWQTFDNGAAPGLFLAAFLFSLTSHIAADLDKKDAINRKDLLKLTTNPHVILNVAGSISVLVGFNMTNISSMIKAIFILGGAVSIPSELFINLGSDVYHKLKSVEKGKERKDLEKGENATTSCFDFFRSCKTKKIRKKPEETTLLTKETTEIQVITEEQQNTPPL